jgi:hypothetical protein
MEQVNNGEKICYVLFARCPPIEDGSEAIILYINEFEDVADAEQTKAEINRTLPKGLNDIIVVVGVAHFHANDENEDLDYLEVTPKDGSKPFMWQEMIDAKDVVEFAKERGL